MYSHSTNKTHTPNIHILSYCDDNSRYTTATTLHEIRQKIQWYIDAGGAFSLVTKLGRKAAKCLVTITNIPPNTPSTQFNSIAWSYQHMYPVQANIKTQFTHKHTDNTMQEQEANISTEPHIHHFGIMINKHGDTTPTGQKTLQKAYTRLKQINRKGLTPEANKAMHDTLTLSVNTFNPLCNQIKLNHAANFDKQYTYSQLSTTNHTDNNPNTLSSYHRNTQDKDTNHYNVYNYKEEQGNWRYI